ncbi:hypothetical protein H4R19_005431, partial [Coemansia spiralis]
RKVGELEDFGAAAAGNSGMDVDAPEFSAAQMADGSRLIERFLAEFTGTPGLDSMPADSVAQRVSELRAKYDSDIAANRWVQHVIATL